MSVTLGVIKRHPLKKKWVHEPNFSDWLASDGLDRIAKLVDMDLCEATREVQVGSYKADIVAKEESGGELVLIENQYNTVNHDHLGKLITYAADIGCKTAILVVEDVRPEAVTTIKWLNEISRDDSHAKGEPYSQYIGDDCQPGSVETVLSFQIK